MANATWTGSLPCPPAPYHETSLGNSKESALTYRDDAPSDHSLFHFTDTKQEDLLTEEEKPVSGGEK